MRKANNFLEILYGWLGTPFVIGYWALGGISYIWSVVIAAKEWGIIAALITFCMPILGQCFWTYKMWKINSFDNTFVMVSVGALLCYLISLVFVSISSKYASQ